MKTAQLSRIIGWSLVGLFALIAAFEPHAPQAFYTLPLIIFLSLAFIVFGIIVTK